jgi:serralysin
MASDNKWCFAWHASTPRSDMRAKAAVLKASAWLPGEIIEISFLDGIPQVQQRVVDAANGWLAPELANVRFAFRDDTKDTPIRISFQYPGSWSVIGATCKQITDKTQATMNYGWLTPNSSEDEVRRVVLHEFGHALGLIHEHQNPKKPIQWSRDTVIADLSGPPNYWSLDVIERNMFAAYDERELNATNLDPNSIMMYPIPASWTLDGFSTKLNGTLSDLDKQLIHQQYP